MLLDENTLKFKTLLNTQNDQEKMAIFSAIGQLFVNEMNIKEEYTLDDIELKAKKFSYHINELAVINVNMLTTTVMNFVRLHRAERKKKEYYHNFSELLGVDEEISEGLVTCVNNHIDIFNTTLKVGKAHLRKINYEDLNNA